MAGGRDQFALSFTICPIFLTNGIAQDMPGGMLPIISITESQSFNDGLLAGGTNISPDNYFAQFLPLQGSTLIDQDVAEYPLANQAVAANAVITKPLMISYRMVCPVRNPGGYAQKRAIITALQASLAQHNASGGTYTCATPFFTWTNCLMLGMRDVSGAEGNQAQTAWQLDFRKPLLTLEEATQVQNNLMSQISNGSRIDADPPAWSGLSNTVGLPPSLAGVSVVPAQSSTAGSGTTGAQVNQ